MVKVAISVCLINALIFINVLGTINNVKIFVNYLLLYKNNDNISFNLIGYLDSVFFFIQCFKWFVFQRND